MKTLTALALVFALAAAAQTPYIETFEVRLHNLDVVVTDAKGKPVRGLTRDDFVVTENGRPQSITNFSVYDVSAGTAASSAGAAPAAEVAATQPPPRRYVFFIDDIAVQKMARNRLYDNAKELLASMREGDVASVVRPTAAAKVVQGFTSDRTALERSLKAAIDASAKEAGERSEIHALKWALQNAGNDTERKMARRQYAFAARRRVEHRLGQLRALTNSLAGLEGRKVVVLVTQGLSTRPGSEAWDVEWEMGVPLEQRPAQVIDEKGNVDFEALGDTRDTDTGRMPRGIVGDFTADVADIGRVAAANGVTIYAIEPDVPVTVNVRGRAELPGKPAIGATRNRYDLPVGFESDLMQNTATTLTTLAEKTGGKWFRGVGSIDDTFRTVSEDLGFYYSLAYRATGEEKARRVEVKVRNRPELRVRTRSEVLEKNTAREMEDLVVASLIYPRPVNELGISVTTAAPVPERGYLRVPLDVVIPLDKLTFLPVGEKYVGAFDIHFAAAGQERDFVSGGKQQQRIELTPEQFEVREGIKYHYKTGIMISPGPARIAIGILDATTKLTGFQTVEVAAPTKQASGGG